MPSPLLAILNGPPAPDLCDDENSGPTGADEFNFISDETPTYGGAAALTPHAQLHSKKPEGSASASNETGEPEAGADGGGDDPGPTLAPQVLSGQLKYTWELYDCVDFTGDNAGAIIVFTHDVQFDDDQGVFNMWEYSWTHRNVESTRVWYKCQTSAGPECIALNRDRAEYLAEVAAEQPPTYASEEASARLTDLQGDDLQFEGALGAKNNGIAWLQDFDGCGIALNVLCIHASAAADLTNLLPV